MHAVFGWFEDLRDVETTLAQLDQVGFKEDQISLVAPAQIYAEFPVEKDAPSVGKATGVGAAAGLSLGGLTGLLAEGLSIAVPGAESLLVSGALVSAIGGAAGATYGALAGILATLDASQEEDTYYTGLVEDGRILIVVEAERERALKARRILGQIAVDASSRSNGALDSPAVHWGESQVNNPDNDVPARSTSKDKERRKRMLAGIFPDLRRADLAIRKLMVAGISEGNIDIIDRAKVISSITPGLDLGTASQIAAGEHMLDVDNGHSAKGSMKYLEKVTRYLAEAGIDKSEAPYYAAKLWEGSVLVIASPDLGLPYGQLEREWNLLHPVYDPDLPGTGRSLKTDSTGQ